MNPSNWVRLLSDDPMTQLGLSFVVVVVYIGLAYLVGRYGQAKGYPFSPAFFLCFLISPLVVVLILALLPARPKAPAPMPLEMILEIEKARLARKQTAQEGSVG